MSHEFEPDREEDYLDSLDPSLAPRAAAENRITYQNEFFERQPFIIFRYDFFSDGSFGLHGKRIKDMATPDETGFDRVESLEVIAQTMYENPDIQEAYFHSPDLGYDRDFGYKFTRDGSGGVRGLAIEYHGTDDDRQNLRRLLSDHSINAGDETASNNLLEPLFFRQEIPIAAFTEIVEKSYVTEAARKKHAEYLERLHYATDRFSELVVEHNTRVEQLANELQQQILEHDDVRQGMHALYQGIRAWATASESDQGAFEKSTKEDIRTKPDADVSVDSAQYSPKPDADVREDSAQHSPNVAVDLVESLENVGERVVEEVTGTAKQTAAVFAKKVQTAVGEKLKKAERIVTTRLKEFILGRDERGESKPITKEVESPVREQGQSPFVVANEQFNNEKHIHQKTGIITGILAVSRFAAETGIGIGAAFYGLEIITSERPRRMHKIKKREINLVQRLPVESKNQLVIKKKNSGEARHLIIKKKKKKREFAMNPVSFKLERAKRTEAKRRNEKKYLRTFERRHTRREQKLKRALRVIARMFKKTKEQPVRMKTKQERKILGKEAMHALGKREKLLQKERKREQVGRFAYAWILWLLVIPSKKGERTLQSESKKPISSEALIRRELGQWVLFAIIWYLAMIREQGIKQMSNVKFQMTNGKQKKRKLTYTLLSIIPVSSLIPSSGVIYAASS